MSVIVVFLRPLGLRLYVSALFAIKSATDYSQQLCQKVATDWKLKQDAGQPTPRLSIEDQTSLNSAKSDVDKMMLKAKNPPEKFAKSSEDLLALYNAYQKTATYASTPTGTLPSFTEGAAKLDADFRRTAQTLKTNLPSRLADELKDKKGKLKALQDL